MTVETIIAALSAIAGAGAVVGGIRGKLAFLEHRVESIDGKVDRLAEGQARIEAIVDHRPRETIVPKDGC